MARGRPKGYRKINGVYVQTGNGALGMSIAAQQTAGIMTGPLMVSSTETDEEISKRIRERFDVVRMMTKDALDGKIRAVFISGPAGMSKSYTVEALIKAADPEKEHSIICKGFTRATGLYKTLYNYQGPKNTVIFDDCDSVFKDEDALNILKAAADTTEDRTIFWGAETNMTDSQGGPLPTMFLFSGSLIFLTNYDMEDAVMRGVSLSPHFTALMSRTHYIDIGLKTVHDYLIRIRQVVNEDGMLKDEGFEDEDAKHILAFVERNAEPVLKFRELTLRLVKKVADLYRNHHDQWQKVAAVTLFRKGMEL